MFAKILLVCLGLTLVFASVGVSADHGRAASAECDHPSPMRFGRMGVIAADADFPCRVRVRAVKPQAVPAMKGGEQVRSAINLRSRVDRGDRAVFDAPAYVYFDLTSAEYGAWRRGKVQILVYDSTEDQWDTLDSVLLEGGRGGRQRIGSRLSKFGLYALGKTN